MLSYDRIGAPTKDLAEGRESQYLLEGCPRLIEDPVPMSHEEEGEVFAGPRPKSAVIERGDHRLARSGRRDDEILMSIVTLSFDRQGLEHSRLKGVWPNFQPGKRHPLTSAASLIQTQRLLESLSVTEIVWIERLEMLRCPMGFEGRPDALDEPGRIGC